jgi:hypothetical protein
MKSFKIICVASLFLMLIAISVEAKCIRCGLDKLACEGDSKFAAINACGEPNYSEEVGSDTHGSVRRGDVDLSERKVEKLYYDCGYGDFVKILTIRNGKIISINDGDRGSGPSRCQ